MGFTASQPRAGSRPKNLENLVFRMCVCARIRVPSAKQGDRDWFG